MTATLQGGINATVKTIRVAGGAAAIPGNAYKIDDELIVLRNFQQWPRAGSPVDPTRWIVKRGRGNSTAASHSNGATIVGVADTLAGGSSLAPPSPFSGGGGSISATDKQIVFMDGTDAVGSADLTWSDVDGVLGLVAEPNGDARIEAIGAGVQMSIKAADGDVGHSTGGEVNLLSGDGVDGGNSGDLTIGTGVAPSGADSGAVTIRSGGATDGQSGEISIRAGGSDFSASGGDLTLRAGKANAGDGGSVDISAGFASGGGNGGEVSISSGNGSYMTLGTVAISLFGGVYNFAGLPTTDPLVAGQLYSDGVPSAGVPKALMVSGG